MRNKMHIVDEKLIQEIKIVLGYLWSDEERHYIESKYRKNHIFTVLKRLARVVNYEP